MASSACQTALEGGADQIQRHAKALALPGKVFGQLGAGLRQDGVVTHLRQGCRARLDLEASSRSHALLADEFRQAADRE